MKVTIALDDISRPASYGAAGRGRVLNIVLPMLKDYGVEDIHLIVATCCGP